MVVISLFDGIAGARVALDRLGYKDVRYFASEVDKTAMSIVRKNWPEVIQIGDVTKISYQDGILYTENGEFNVGKVDLLVGGSPCQGFSFAGKQLNFEDERSKLFFEFARLLKEISPRFFLLENVKMRAEYQDVISKMLGTSPIEINSRLVSAQNRKRLYWTDIGGIIQPEDYEIFLKDILECGEVDRDKSFCVDANYYKGGNLYQYFKKSRRQLVFKDYFLLQGIKEFISEGNNLVDLTFEKIKTRANRYRVNHTRGLDEKSRCVTTSCTMTSAGGTGLYVNGVHRSLFPVECERLQTFPDGYTEYGVEELKIDHRKCAKQTVVAVIENNGRFFIGSNWCENPQKECPRGDLPSGVGYEKCKEICGQKYHAEVDACKKAGREAKGGTLYLIGHTYACDDCKKVMNEYGIEKLVIGKFPIKKVAKTQRYKALGNAFTVDVIKHILSFMGREQ